jgi:hypothetical protein
MTSVRELFCSCANLSIPAIRAAGSRIVTVGVVPVVTGRPDFCLTVFDLAIFVSYTNSGPEES